MAATRLLIVDSDDRYWRPVEPDLAADPRFGQVYRVATCEQAILCLHAVRPTVAVVDMTVPGPATADLMQRLTGSSPAVPVVAISAALDDGRVGYAVGAGASACLPRTAQARQMTATIIEVAGGGMPIQRDLSERPELLSRLISDFQRRLRGNGRGSVEQCPLTVRELTILDLVAGGQANKEIASALEISERTVKNHMTNILAKLMARDRAHAVRIGIQNAWICRDQWTPEPAQKAAA
ncbi:MAG: response regulator transcription factor [Dehalococcoidia bacterium]